MEHYLYFAEGGGADATTEAVCYAASRFVGVEPITATTTGIYFESALGDVDGGGGAGDLITVTHADTHATAGSYHRAKLIAEAMAEVVNRGPHATGKMTSVIDMDTGSHFGAINTIKDDASFGIAVTLDT
tara:strand:+ start:513 stop:902 length:390 start_codon:yes stop_codon:yes gene_type:complete